MKLVDQFDKIFVINLDIRPDRRRLITRELRKISSSEEDFQGKIEFYTATKPQTSNGFPSASVYGCFLSHYTIIKKAIDLDLRNVLILEDDLHFTDFFLRNEEKVIDALANVQYDLAYLGYFINNELNTSELLVPYKEQIIATHFYAINSTVMKRLYQTMSEMKERPRNHPNGGKIYNDGMVNLFRFQNDDVRTYLVNPVCGIQRFSKSDLHSRWYDHVVILKGLANMIRTLKNRLILNS
ncbi:MAG: glycosyltransferase family 25 protein [Cyclobacteriaceae bacterium]|nr:glycosyltransferase family 25 protein [Cyclobacteriaceae bacterium HetDA_MAG_MS6]